MEQVVLNDIALLLNSFYSPNAYVLHLPDRSVETVNKPASLTWFNIDLKCIAWTESIENDIHFADDLSLPPADCGIRFEAQGKYFCHNSALYHIDNPTTALTHAPIYPDAIFLRGNRLYLFQRVIKTSFFEKHGLKYLSYEIKDDELVLEKEGYIEAFMAFPLFVQDIDPTGEYLVLYSHSDPPFNEFISRWYLYNMNAGSLTPGARLIASKAYARFLADNYFGG
jgi:hypothetical protein